MCTKLGGFILVWSSAIGSLEVGHLLVDCGVQNIARMLEPDR